MAELYKTRRLTIDFPITSKLIIRLLESGTYRSALAIKQHILLLAEHEQSLIDSKKRGGSTAIVEKLEALCESGGLVDQIKFSNATAGELE